MNVIVTNLNKNLKDSQNSKFKRIGIIHSRLHSYVNENIIVLSIQQSH